MKSPILFDMRKTRVQSILDALAIALPSVLLLPAVLLAAIPIFSLPLGAASLYFFEWVYPEQFGSVITGFRFGLWGTCRLARVDSLFACTRNLWGYDLDLEDLAIGQGQVVSGELSKALAVTLPFTAILAFISLILHTVAAIQHTRYPEKANAGVAKAAVVLQALALPFGIASAVVAFKAYGPGVSGINGATESNIASLGPCAWMVLVSPVLVLISLLAVAWGAYHARRTLEQTNRRSGGQGKWRSMNDYDFSDSRAHDNGAYRLDWKSSSP